MSKDSVVVIGGGIAGILSALTLKRAGYEVTLLERRDDVHSEISAIPGRMQYGGLYVAEYARSHGQRSNAATGCIVEAIASLQMLQGPIFSNDSGSVFAISRAAATDPDYPLTTEVYDQFWQHLGRYYQHLVSLDPANHVLADADPSTSVFDMVQRIPDEAWAEHYDPTQVVAAYATAEPGMSVPKIAVGLKNMLAREGVEVVTGAAVTDIEENAHGVTVKYTCGGQSHQQRFGQAVQSAGIGGRNLDLKMGIQYEVAYDLKLAAEMLVPQSATNTPTTYIMNYHGGANWQQRGNGQTGIILSPARGAMNIDTIYLAKDQPLPPLPELWQQYLRDEAGLDDAKRRGLMSIELAGQYIHTLRGNPDELLQRTAARPVVRHGGSIHERDHVGLYGHSPEGNYHATTAVKYFSGPVVALEVLKAVEARAVEKGLIQESDRVMRHGQPILPVPAELRFALEIDLRAALEQAQNWGFTPGILPRQQRCNVQDNRPAIQMAESEPFLAGGEVDLGLFGVEGQRAERCRLAAFDPRGLLS